MCQTTAAARPCQPLMAAPRRGVMRHAGGPLERPPALPYKPGPCGYDVTVACQLPKLDVRVRFPLPAPVSSAHPRSPRNRSKPGPAGLVAPDPLGAVAGALLGGNRKEISLAADLDEGLRFMAVTDSKTRCNIAAAVFEREGSDHNLKGL